MPSFGKQKVTRLIAYGMIRGCGRAKGKERPQGFVIKEQALTLLKWRQGLFHQHQYDALFVKIEHALHHLPLLV